jgi:hypothetical protein
MQIHRVMVNWSQPQQAAGPVPGRYGPARKGMPMSTLDLSRWQFGITTVYHFIFVPLTIGLSFLVAGLQTAWVVKKDPAYLRLTTYFGRLFLINFAVGVVTGIVQEFQFGMNWSAYSKFVGDVFGAPLAMEALLAFFMESTFLGLWIFGWNKPAAIPIGDRKRPLRPSAQPTLERQAVVGCNLAEAIQDQCCIDRGSGLLADECVDIWLLPR